MGMSRPNSRLPCQTPIPALSVVEPARLSMSFTMIFYRFTMSCPLGDLLPCCVPRAEHKLTLLPPFSMCVNCFAYHQASY